MSILNICYHKLSVGDNCKAIIIIIIIQHLYSAIMSYADTEALEAIAVIRHLLCLHTHTKTAIAPVGLNV